MGGGAGGKREKAEPEPELKSFSRDAGRVHLRSRPAINERVYNPVHAATFP